jgi:DNA-binding CsgD family transcriptional regulator
MELLKGRTRSQIGEALFISPETVKWHTSRIYRKLGVSSRIQLLQRVLGETDVPSAE